MGPHWSERGRTICDYRFFSDDSSALPTADANGIELPSCGVDAAGYGNPGCTTASTSAEGEAQGCASGTKAGGACTGETEPEADARFSRGKSRATEDKDLGCQARGTQSGIRTGENRCADEPAKAAERRSESRQSWNRQRCSGDRRGSGEQSANRRLRRSKRRS